MSLNPQVSVVMTAYCNLQYLPAAIESVLDQDFSPLELILVDDGSTDDIASIIAPYRDRLRYIRQENQGPGAARDAGLREARAEFVAFCDSDDLQRNFRLSAHRALLQAHPNAALVFSDLATYEDGRITAKSTLRERRLGLNRVDFDEAIYNAFEAPSSCAELGITVPTALADKPVYSGRVPALIASRHVAWEGASMMRKSMVVGIGEHDKDLRYMEDWSFISRISKLHELVFWDAPVVLYRQHPGQLTKQGNAIALESYRNVVVRVWKDDKELKTHHPQLHKRLVVRAYLQNVHYAIEAGEFKRARADIMACLKVDRFNSVCYRQLLRCSFFELRDRFRNSEQAVVTPGQRFALRPAYAWVATAVIAALLAGKFVTDKQLPDVISLPEAPSNVEAAADPFRSADFDASAIIEPIFSAWEAGRLQESVELGRQVTAELPQYPTELQRHLVRHLVNLSVSLGRIDDALAIANNAPDPDERTELQARIYFASGERDRSADLLKSGSVFRTSGTALLMAMAGLEEGATSLVATTAAPDRIAARRTVIQAMAEMQAGNMDNAKQLFRAATEDLTISDGAFYFVAFDMLAGVIKSEGDLDGSIKLLENTMPQRDLSARNGSAIFWLMCQRNLAALYRTSGREDDAVNLENILRARLKLSDDSFPLARSLAGV